MKLTDEHKREIEAEINNHEFIYYGINFIESENFLIQAEEKICEYQQMGCDNIVTDGYSFIVVYDIEYFNPEGHIESVSKDDVKLIDLMVK
jgi:hypothetical protein